MADERDEREQRRLADLDKRARALREAAERDALARTHHRLAANAEREARRLRDQERIQGG